MAPDAAVEVKEATAADAEERQKPQQQPPRRRFAQAPRAACCLSRWMARCLMRSLGPLLLRVGCQQAQQKKARNPRYVLGAKRKRSLLGLRPRPTTVNKRESHLGYKLSLTLKTNQWPIMETSLTWTRPTSPLRWIALLCRTRVDAAGEALTNPPGSDVRAAAGLLPSLPLPCMLWPAVCSLSSGSIMPIFGMAQFHKELTVRKPEAILVKLHSFALCAARRSCGACKAIYGFLRAKQGDIFTRSDTVAGTTRAWSTTTRAFTSLHWTNRCWQQLG